MSGWGLVDTLYTAARAEDDSVVWALLDVDASLTATPQELVVVNASRTVALHFDDVFVPAERVVTITPLQPTSPDALRLNGALALAVARRCILLLDGEDDGFPLELSACREELDSAEDVAAARAHAADLALRAAATLVVRQGAKAILRDHHGQRLMREAAFLLVFGTRAPIQQALLGRLMT